MNHTQLLTYLKKHATKNNLKNYELQEQTNKAIPFNYVLSVTLESGKLLEWWLYDMDIPNSNIPAPQRTEWNKTVFEQLMHEIKEEQRDISGIR